MTTLACKTRVQSDSQGSDRGRILELVKCLRNLLRQVPNCWLLRKQPPPERSANNANFNTFRRVAYRRVYLFGFFTTIQEGAV